MNILIGDKIRELRKSRGITQEQLAESIGISFQAVSKWENHIALPDITLVPALANYFNVTCDELFGINIMETEGKIASIYLEAAEYRESDPAKSRMILEEGLERYPDNDILLNNLLYVIDYTANPDETIRLASRLIDKTNMSVIKYDALRFLAYAYNSKGDIVSAVAALEQIPEIYFTKLSELAFVQTGKEKYDAAEKQKWISFEMLLQMMQKIAECYEADSECEKAIGETERALKLISALEGDTKIDRFKFYTDYFEQQIERYCQTSEQDVTGK